MATYDPDGTLIDERTAPLYINGTRRQQGLGWLLDGGALWEILHPGQVQDEYRAVGAQTIPTVAEIESAAINRAIDTARADTQGAGDSLKTLLKLGAVIVIGIAVIEVAGKIPAPRGKSLRTHYAKRARRAIARRIAG